MKKNTLFMETTKIHPAQTVSTIQQILGSYGATAILTEYENGEVSAVSFKVRVNNQDVPFLLPCRDKAIFDIFYKRKKRGTHKDSIIDCMKDQAKRVAWRQILRWIEAQLALVSTKMVTMEEVFMPYMQLNNGKTIYQIVSDKNFKMLEAPE